MPKIKINDIDMYYEIHGKGQPLVFVSGFAADHLGWMPVLDAFSKYYQVILLNNRGAGQTTVPRGPYSIEQMSDDIAGLCKALEIPSAHFIGNSMGGHLVQMLAHRHPTLVKSLVIGNSCMTLESVFVFYTIAELALLKTNAPREMLIKATLSWVFSFQFLSNTVILDSLVKMAMNNPYPFTVTGYEGQHAALSQFNSSTWAKEINVPTLVITSDQDIIIPPRLSAALAAEIKNARYYTFNNCGHLPHIEYPAAYIAIVKDFLSELST